MNKAELVESVQRNMGADASKAAAERAVEAVLNGIKEGLENSASVTLVGFGTFSVVERAARKGVNPQTKQPMDIPASKSIKFKPGAGLKNLV